MMHTTLHPCQMTTKQTLDRTTKAIGQTTRPMKKKKKRLTTPKNSVKSPTPSITPPTWYWINQNREAKSQWYMHVPLRYNQPKHQWLGKQEWRQVGKNNIYYDWQKYQRLLPSRYMVTMWLHAHDQRIHAVPSWYEWKNPATRTNKLWSDDNSQPRPHTGLDTSRETNTNHFPPHLQSPRPNDRNYP